MCKKCGKGVSMKFGDYDVDMCQYEDIQKVANVTVVVSRCAVCGNISISWFRQVNSEDLPLDGEEDDI